MPNLTASQESFIQMMVSEDDLARRGFELLLKRHDFDRFFDALKAAGLFDAARNPAPIPTEKPGHFRIPYWAALNYLVAVAKLSGDQNNLELSEKVMAVIRTVAAWRGPGGAQRENYVTAWKFAEMLGLLPTAAVTLDDLKFIPEWLNTRFEKMLVGRSLDEGAMTKFLASPSAVDWEKAVVVLRHCTQIEWEGPDKDERTPRMAVDSFWLRQMIRHQATALGERVGQKASEVFVERVREIFGAGTRNLYSETYRPAIEDDPQNRDWHEIENCSIEGLRDVLMSWCGTDPVAAKPFVEGLLLDPLEILRRVGIYVLWRQWPSWRDLYVELAGKDLFTPRLLHELYEFLKERFRDMDEVEKAVTVDAIRRIPPPQGGSNPNLSLKRIQHLWLSAISGNDYAPADKWFSELEAEPDVGPIAKHPSFGSYIESGWVGPGASQYSVAELVAFAAARVVVEKLNAFEERDPWRGPTAEGLAAALGTAVRTAPGPFLESLPDFIGAKWRYQHSLITGLQQSWEATDVEHKTDWSRGWQSVLEFFQQLIESPEFWHEDSPETSRRDWIASAMADCLDAGTKRDEHAYPPELLPRAQTILHLLLDRARSTDEPSDDPMTRALNTPKGRAVEALFSHALRVCRVADQSNGSHADQWNDLEPLFDSELAKCKNRNYEFSTLSGLYIAQLQYMDEKWTRERIQQIFPAEFQQNSMCAIDGLGYSSLSRPVYLLLTDAAIIDRALTYDLPGRSGRGKLLERIGAAYLWGIESIDSPRFVNIFKSGKVDDLEVISRIFWMVRGEPLSPEQKNKIIEYWKRCILWSQALPEKPNKLLSSLGALACYLNTADGPDRELLELVAPFVHLGHNSYEFVEQLLRLAATSPDGVSGILTKMLDGGIPDFDYKDQLRTLLTTLADRGKTQDVRLHAERLRDLPGMQELFDRLTLGN